MLMDTLTNLTEEILQRIEHDFKHHADETKAIGMRQYMRNQFDFYGLPAPIRAVIAKQFLIDYPIANWKNEVKALSLELWEKPEREYHYMAIFLLEKAKYWKEEESITLFEQLVLSHSWWDSVDALNKSIGLYFKQFPKERDLTTTWNTSDNFWLQRLSIIFQLTYKEKTDTTLLYQHIKNRANSKEFFVQKAIGWSLRQYARTDAEAVKDFLNTHFLPPLSVKEALKHLNK